MSLQTLGNKDCAVGGLWQEGNYLLGRLAGLLSGPLACRGAWKLAVWLPHNKYHGSGLPRESLFCVPADVGNEDCAVAGRWLERNYVLGCLAGLLSGLLACWGAWKLAVWLPRNK